MELREAVKIVMDGMDKVTDEELRFLARDASVERRVRWRIDEHMKALKEKGAKIVIGEPNAE